MEEDGEATSAAKACDKPEELEETPVLGRGEKGCRVALIFCGGAL
jgi:hypothetical protein